MFWKNKDIFYILGVVLVTVVDSLKVNAPFFTQNLLKKCLHSPVSYFSKAETMATQHLKCPLVGFFSQCTHCMNLDQFF